jgi:hypothetical protein
MLATFSPFAAIRCRHTARPVTESPALLPRVAPGVNHDEADRRWRRSPNCHGTLGCAPMVSMCAARPNAARQFTDAVQHRSISSLVN